MADHDLDSLIHRAREGEAPSSGQQKRVREALAQRIASGEAAPDIGGTSPLPARSGLAIAGAAGGLGLLVVGALAVYALGREVPSEPHATPGARPSTRAVPSAPHEPALHEPVLQQRPSTQPMLENVGAQGNAPAGSTNADPRATAAASAPRVTAAPETSVKRAPRVDHEAERRALARVQHALRDERFAEALAELERDDRSFAGGALVEERAAARVLATCGREDAAEARRLAAAFVVRYPSSPLRARVVASCKPSAPERSP